MKYNLAVSTLSLGEGRTSYIRYLLLTYSWRIRSYPLPSSQTFSRLLSKAGELASVIWYISMSSEFTFNLFVTVYGHFAFHYITSKSTTLVFLGFYNRQMYCAHAHFISWQYVSITLGRSRIFMANEYIQLTYLLTTMSK